MAQQRYTLDQLVSPLGLWRWTFGLTMVALVLDLAFAAKCAADLVMGPAYLGRDLLLSGLGTLVALSLFAVLVTLIILVCKISYRAMRNLHILNPPVTLVAPPWAAGWYFVPGANVVLPFMALRLLQQGTDAFEVVPHAATDSTWPWWGAWIATLVAGFAAVRLALQSADTGAGFPNETVSGMALVAAVVAALLHAVCALFFMDVFGRLCRAQDALVARHAPSAHRVD